ncbi:zf-TFIIB domain-containing protein [Idiomarina sp. HP20-50]|uniref:TFIIB-type zinc ribbon-containing protein n=1 Tax=Idiomarina sp. HP20-50 TaxID=3070813 RepID=UPI00294B3956|nr:zf-TFIIB domain-containing protein [Idiomarina sp. HP20-50]MDV6316696.1 zf-TFIIB domain-containing protein [Idiomarina sp. HP20-50]
MKCPVCPEENLMMTDRQGIEIDYCPKCRGIWLDRGELDKLIERTADERPAAQPQSRPQQHQPQYQGGYGDSGRHGYKKKKKGLLGELFDF